MKVKVLYLLLVLSICLLIVTNYSRSNDGPDPVAVKALNLLYTFQTPEELDLNMEGLKLITTDEVYRQLTIDKTERILNVYLKFKNKPSFVEIVSAEKGLITYRLITESLSEDRLFMFKYEVTKGKISSLFEGEIVPFPNSIGE